MTASFSKADRIVHRASFELTSGATTAVARNARYSALRPDPACIYVKADPLKPCPQEESARARRKAKGVVGVRFTLRRKICGCPGMARALSLKGKDSLCVITRIAEIEREVDVWRAVALSLTKDEASELAEEAERRLKRVDAMEAEIERLWGEVRRFR